MSLGACKKHSPVSTQSHREMRDEDAASVRTDAAVDCALLLAAVATGQGDLMEAGKTVVVSESG